MPNDTTQAGQKPYKIFILSESHLEAVDDLGRPFRKTLGFLPAEALRNLLRKGWVYGAVDSNETLLGYLIFAKYTDRFQITQLCVAKGNRGKGLARELVNKLKSERTTQKVIKLWCRRDFEAYSIWKHLNFVPLGERPGRSKAGFLLTLWCYRLASDDELGLWSVEASDNSLDVVIDAQIFFDFDAADSPSTLISKGLHNDYLIDSLNLWITDELFLEINRNQDNTGRGHSRDRAHGFPRVEHNERQFDNYTQILREILPYRTDSDKSDIHQLAKTAASSVKIFVTKDERIIRRAKRIKDSCGIQVVHPIALITNLHEEIERHSFSPSRISGLTLCWIRGRGKDVESLVSPPFRILGETKRKRREALLAKIANPSNFQFDVLFSNGEPVAYRVISKIHENRLRVVRADTVENYQFELYGKFLVADCLSNALTENLAIVEFCEDASNPPLGPILNSMGFFKAGAAYQRVVLPEVMTRSNALSRISCISPKLESQLSSLPELDLERSCSPLVLRNHVPAYLIPIRPAFAMGLLDRQQSAEDLFGGDPTVLLRLDNVYYRAKSHHLMLSAPGRILWYVSRSCGEIAAVSHLDEVEIGKPKDLFKKYKRFGIFEWRDIYNICKRDMEREIMALKFSQTFPLRNRIPLSEMRAVFKKHGVGGSLQAPLRLPEAVFAALFKMGYSIPE